MTRGDDYIEPVVAQEDCQREQSSRDAECRENERHYCPGAVPSQMFGRNLVASIVIPVGSETGGARDARVVERIAVFATRNTTPTTLIL